VDRTTSPLSNQTTKALIGIKLLTRAFVLERVTGSVVPVRHSFLAPDLHSSRFSARQLRMTKG
jgi:hypothetical protein